MDIKNELILVLKDRMNADGYLSLSSKLGVQP